MSYSNSDYSSDSSSELEIATQSCRQSMLAPSKKHCRTVGVEVEIPSRSFAKRTGRPVSASKTSSMAQTRSQQAMPVHSASSSDVINPRQQISPAKEASTVKSVAAGPAAQSATSPVNDAGSGQAGTETMPHIPNIEKQMSTGDLQPETTEVLKGKVIPTINAEEAVRRAIQAVVSPVYSRASSLSSIAATTAVDLPLSHQAAAASSSGRSRPVHSTVPASSAVHSDSNSLSTEAKHTTVIRHPKPPLYPSSRLKASATASTGVNAEQSDVQVSNTSKSTVSAEPAINTTAGPKIGRFSSLFPSLSREESVESALPDLTELFKHTTTRHACAVVQAEKNDVVYVKSSLGDGHGAKRRRKLAGYALVKEESQDC